MLEVGGSTPFQVFLTNINVSTIHVLAEMLSDHLPLPEMRSLLRPGTTTVLRLLTSTPNRGQQFDEHVLQHHYPNQKISHLTHLPLLAAVTKHQTTQTIRFRIALSILIIYTKTL